MSDLIGCDGLCAWVIGGMVVSFVVGVVASLLLLLWNYLGGE